MLAFTPAPQQAPANNPAVDRALNARQPILPGLGSLEDRLHGAYIL